MLTLTPSDGLRVHNNLCISEKIANFAVANGCRLFGLHCGLRKEAVCKRLTDKSKLIKL